MSARREAQELDIPLWKANELCWSLDRRIYGPGGIHNRVTRASLDAFKKLLSQGVTYQAARAVMWRYRVRGELPPADLNRETTYRIHWRSRQRW